MIPGSTQQPRGRIAVWTAVAGTVFIAAAAFWLSFTALADLARRSGVDESQWLPGGESQRERGQRAHLPGKPSPRPLKEHTVIDIDPNTDGLPGIEQLRVIVGAAMTVGLILAVLALIISAVVWGYGANSSNPHLASRGKVGVLVSCGAAIICGASVTLVNFFWNVGQSV